MQYAVMLDDIALAENVDVSGPFKFEECSNEVLKQHLTSNYKHCVVIYCPNGRIMMISGGDSQFDLYRVARMPHLFDAERFHFAKDALEFVEKG